MENTSFMRVEEVAQELGVSKDMEQQRKQTQRTRRRNTNYER